MALQERWPLGCSMPSVESVVSLLFPTSLSTGSRSLWLPASAPRSLRSHARSLLCAAFSGPTIIGRLSNNGKWRSSLYFLGAFCIASALMALGRSLTRLATSCEELLVHAFPISSCSRSMGIKLLPAKPDYHFEEACPSPSLWHAGFKQLLSVPISLSTLECGSNCYSVALLQGN